MRSCILFLSIFCSGLVSQAQIRAIPQVVKDSFQAHYPVADSVIYHDNIVNVQVSFNEKGSRMLATFTNKGLWKQTERTYSFENLSPSIKEGFDKSKYSIGWTVRETVILFLPDGTERYRVKVGKNDLQRRYLFFDTTGRLVRDALTI